MNSLLIANYQDIHEHLSFNNCCNCHTLLFNQVTMACKLIKPIVIKPGCGDVLVPHELHHCKCPCNSGMQLVM